MPKVEFHPSGQTVQVPPQTGLLDAARQAGVEIESPCGGEGTCGKCIVRVASGEVDSRSLGLLARCRRGRRLCPGLRDAHSRGRPDGGSAGTGGAWKAGNSLPRTRPTWSGRSCCPSNGNLIRWQSSGWCRSRPPQLESGLSDLDRLTRAIQQDWGKQPVEYSLLGIRKLADTLRAAEGQVTATIVRDSGRLHVINIEPGDTTLRHYAMAVDVGTTTIAVQLINLAVAQIVAARSDYNDQIACGLDVISRINYARTPGAAGRAARARAGHDQPADSPGGQEPRRGAPRKSPTRPSAATRS